MLGVLEIEENLFFRKWFDAKYLHQVSYVLDACKNLNNDPSNSGSLASAATMIDAVRPRNYHCYYFYCTAFRVLP